MRSYGILNWEWVEEAKCKTEKLDIFYLEKERILANAIKREFCLNCPVRRQCLEAAVIIPEQYGIWGGMTPRERKTYKHLRERGATHIAAMRKVDQGWCEDTVYQWDDLKGYAYEKAEHLKNTDT